MEKAFYCSCYTCLVNYSFKRLRRGRGKKHALPFFAWYNYELTDYINELFLVDSKLLAVTAKESIEGIYVDGVQIALQNGSNWLETDSISIWSASRLIAVIAQQLNSSCIGPGIMASVTDSRGNYVVTSASWRCSPVAQNGWSDLGYDDSPWQPATVLKSNSGLEVR